MWFLNGLESEKENHFCIMPPVKLETVNTNIYNSYPAGKYGETDIS